MASRCHFRVDDHWKLWSTLRFSVDVLLTRIVSAFIQTSRSNSRTLMSIITLMVFDLVVSCPLELKLKESNNLLWMRATVVEGSQERLQCIQIEAHLINQPTVFYQSESSFRLLLRKIATNKRTEKKQENLQENEAIVICHNDYEPSLRQ